MAEFLDPPDFPLFIFNMISRNSSNSILPDPSKSTAELLQQYIRWATPLPRGCPTTQKQWRGLLVPPRRWSHCYSGRGCWSTCAALPKLFPRRRSSLTCLWTSARPSRQSRWRKFRREAEWCPRFRKFVRFWGYLQTFGRNYYIKIIVGIINRDFYPKRLRNYFTGYLPTLPSLLDRIFFNSQFLTFAYQWKE